MTRTERRHRCYWTEWELWLLSALYSWLPTSAIARALGREVHGVYQMATKMGLKKSPEFFASDWSGGFKKGRPTGGESHRFQKGHVPANKGLRRPGWHCGRMSETQFKKGERPHTWKPIGTILADHEGYLRIKVRERGPKDAAGWNREVWPLLSHEVWRKHKGPIPPKHLVAFKDGNRSNCAIGNLELRSMKEHRLRNSMWAMYPPELAKAIQLNGALKRKLRRANAEE